MRNFLLALAAALLVLTILAPAWPWALVEAPLLWLTCPDFNVLGQKCGPITLEFGLDHWLPPLLVAWVLYQYWRHRR